MYKRKRTSTYVGDGQTGCGLATDNASDSGLVLDNAVRDTHFAAKSGQKENQLEYEEI